MAAKPPPNRFRQTEREWWKWKSGMRERNDFGLFIIKLRLSKIRLNICRSKGRLMKFLFQIQKLEPHRSIPRRNLNSQPPPPPPPPPPELTIAIHWSFPPDI
jgi:hypothetical protein